MDASVVGRDPETSPLGERLAAIVESSDDAILAKDLDGITDRKRVLALIEA